MKLLSIMILSLLFACGEKEEDTSTEAVAEEAEEAQEETEESTEGEDGEDSGNEEDPDTGAE